MRETKLWTWHILTAAVVLVLLSLHMLVMHMDLLVGYLSPAGGRAIAWENVWARAKMPASVVIYIGLLGAALYHGLFGLRNILFEWIGYPCFQKVMNVLLVLGGLGLFAIGSWAAVAAQFVGE